ncbi:hypothetical protein FO440_17050 [Mucilaginibacter corticis]|uniref:Uncharacterized protein n=1 Tax=Mucilaginibacter corticis TaxID=2597670 RepID=A0A556MHR4_9SPHI|nr:glycosyl hydrolase 108 family protein [Mucilaginibacter corticis]TSJ39451.1 hypothetical protein FO440_17050 [Mucilaginibacter corticis]
MAQFDPAYAITMHNEGGYANNPSDHGGETYKGIAIKFWPNWHGWPIVHSIAATHPASLNTALAANADLQQMVQSFYKANFWDTESLDNVTDQQVANQLFDIATNMGTGIAARFMQEAVNTLSPGKLTVDGQIGPLSLAALNGANQQSLYNAIIQLRKARYQAIIAKDPSQQQFANSWNSRMPAYVV